MDSTIQTCHPQRSSHKGLVTKGFSGAFTRLPQSTADCPGVIDYVCGPPSILRLLPNGSLTVGDAIPDLSDHLPSTVEVEMGDSDPPSAPTQHQHFQHERLEVLKIPQDNDTWEQIEKDISSAPELQNICDSLHAHLSDRGATRADAQEVVDTNIDRLVQLMYKVFRSHRLVRKRNFGGKDQAPPNSRVAAPPELRELRKKARDVHKRLVTLIRSGGDAANVQAIKKEWNQLTHQCRTLSAKVRTGFHANWRTMWHRLSSCAPRELWQTYRRFTKQSAVEPASTPD